MIQDIAWLKSLGSALAAFSKKVAAFAKKSDKRRVRKKRDWWFDFDFKRMRFKGGSTSRFDQN